MDAPIRDNIYMPSLREMQKGARLSERILNEFEPELERIRVDTIAKDSKGNPTIQRVRVIKGRG